MLPLAATLERVEQQRRVPALPKLVVLLRRLLLLLLAARTLARAKRRSRRSRPMPPMSWARRRKRARHVALRVAQQLLPLLPRRLPHLRPLRMRTRSYCLIPRPLMLPQRRTMTRASGKKTTTNPCLLLRRLRLRRWLTLRPALVPRLLLWLLRRPLLLLLLPSLDQFLECFISPLSFDFLALPVGVVDVHSAGRRQKKKNSKKQAQRAPL
jgi:hypothetical protein